jgi:hypothetical protein
MKTPFQVAPTETGEAVRVSHRTKQRSQCSCISHTPECQSDNQDCLLSVAHKTKLPVVEKTIDSVDVFVFVLEEMISYINI